MDSSFSGGAYVLGAPEFVLREDCGRFKVQIEKYSSDGYRVLVFGRYSGVPDGKELTEAVTPFGLVLLSNPIRRDAPKPSGILRNRVSRSRSYPVITP